MSEAAYEPVSGDTDGSIGRTGGSHIPFLRSSLEFLIVGFNSLVQEMDKFDGITQEEREELGTRLWNMTQYARDNNPEGGWQNLFHAQFAAQSEPKFIFMERYYGKFIGLAIPIILVSAALCEAVINSIVASSLVAEGREDLFFAFERKDTVQKWAIGPMLLADGIKIDKGSPHFGILKDLFTMRNAFLHSKSDIFSADGKKIKGTTHNKIILDKSGINRVIAYSKLSDNLLDLLISSNPSVTRQLDIRFAAFPFKL